MSSDAQRGGTRRDEDLLASLDEETIRDLLRSGDLEKFGESGDVDRLIDLATTAIDGLESIVPGRRRNLGAAEFDPFAAVGRLGRFDVLRELGRGGQGIVFLAVDGRTGQNVALKVPRMDALWDLESRKAFLNAAKDVVGLDHPCIAPVREVGESGAVCYIASDYFGESTLSSWFDSRTAPVGCRTAAAVVAAVARGVAFLHDHSILHRDVKPSNVLLQSVERENLPDPELFDVGLPRLTDFGLVRPAEPSSATMTGTAVLQGTPEYMSPEQAAGRADAVSRASDVYSLGAVLYELLAGKPPSKGRNRFDTIRILTTQEPMPLRRLRADVHRDLCAVCHKCLERVPSRRYTTASELADDLNRWLAGKRTIARPASVVRRLSVWSRQHPMRAAFFAAAVGIASLVGMFGWVAYRQERAAQAELLGDLYFSVDEAAVVPLAPRVRSELATLRNRLETAFRGPDANPTTRLRAAAALAPSVAEAREYLERRTESATPDQLRLIADGCIASGAVDIERWLGVANDPTEEASVRIRGASLAALLARTLDGWKATGEEIAQLLHDSEPLLASRWSQLLRPAWPRMFKPLSALCEADSPDSPRIESAAAVLAEMFDGTERSANLLVEEVERTSPQAFDVLFSRLASYPNAVEHVERQFERNGPSGARAQANLIIALARLGRTERLTAGFREGPASQLPFVLAQNASRCRLPPRLLCSALETEKDAAASARLLVALGKYQLGRLPKAERDRVVESVRTRFAVDPDAAVHSSSGWVLRQWKVEVEEKHLAFDAGRNWYSVRGGPEMLVIRARAGNGKGTLKSLSIAARETTVSEFARFDATKARPNAPSLPVADISAIDAAKYCNWLTAYDGLVGQECYVFGGDGPKLTVKLVPGRSGYRLPSLEEFNGVCGSSGEREYLQRVVGSLLQCERLFANSGGRLNPVGQLQPNAFGLFDVYGNAAELCLNSNAPEGALQACVYGGSSRSTWERLPKTRLHLAMPLQIHDFDVGFRVARSLPHD